MRKVRPILLLPLACLLTGCLEFESQTLSYRYDKASDSLLIFQDYHGIFGGAAEGNPDKPLSADEESQLESVLEGQRTFFFNNWIFEFDRANVEEALANLKDPEKLAESTVPPEGIAAYERLLNLLLENVHIENGPFYLGPDDKLCGVQMVTLANCTSVLKAINDCAPFAIQEAIADEDTAPEERAAAVKFMKKPRPCVEMDGNALAVRWPVPKTSFDGEDFGSEEDRARLAEAGLATSFADDVITFELGTPDDEITTLTLDFSETAYTPNLLGPAREAHVVRESFDPAAAAKAFLLQQE